MFDGMGPITSKTLSSWQRTGDDAPRVRSVLVAYGSAVIFVIALLVLLILR